MCKQKDTYVLTYLVGQVKCRSKVLLVRYICVYANVQQY